MPDNKPSLRVAYYNIGKTKRIAHLATEDQQLRKLIMIYLETGHEILTNIGLKSYHFDIFNLLKLNYIDDI